MALPLLYDALVRAASSQGSLPTCKAKPKGVSVIIPVRNDQEHLMTKLSELCRPSSIPMEIIVVDSSDSPLRSLPPCPHSLKYVRFEKRGKVRALNEGFKLSSYDVLLFTDVDAHNITPEVVTSLAKRLCGELGLITPKVKHVVKDDRVRWLEGKYFERASSLSVAESKVWSATVFTGSFMMIRREDLERLGGFPEDVGADDTFLAHRVSLILGKRAVWLNSPEVVEHIDERLGDYLKKKVRRAQHLQQAFLKSAPLLPKGRGSTAYKLMMLTRFYLNLINPFVGALGYLGSFSTPLLWVPLTLAILLTPYGRLWALNQLTLIAGLLKNLKGRGLEWK